MTANENNPKAKAGGKNSIPLEKNLSGAQVKKVRKGRPANGPSSVKDVIHILNSTVYINLTGINIAQIILIGVDEKVSIKYL